VTAPLIAPVIPPRSAARRGHGLAGRAGAASPLPLASAPGRPAVLRDVVYGIGRMDASGRVADRTVAAALRWCGGDRLTLTAQAGVVVVRRDPDGMVTLPASQYIVIPAVLRHRCGLAAGDLVLLAARPDESMLAAYPFGVVDRALRAHLPFPGSGGDQS
jgi:hypothetical protein